MHPDDCGTGGVTEFARALQSGAREYQADYRVVWPGGRVRSACTRAARSTATRPAA